MTFGRKLHHMLMSPECRGIISWMPHGRAFRILVPKKMEQDSILSKYFGHSRYSTFLSQLKNNGLKMITRGKDRMCFYHECLLRGLPHLTRYMPAYKEGRRLIPDPANEPDFYTISALCPVPLENPRRVEPSHNHSLAFLQNVLTGNTLNTPSVVNMIPQVSSVAAPSASSQDVLQTLRALAGELPRPQAFSIPIHQERNLLQHQHVLQNSTPGDAISALFGGRQQLDNEQLLGSMNQLSQEELVSALFRSFT